MTRVVSADILDHSAGRVPVTGLSKSRRLVTFTKLDHEDGNVPVTLLNDKSMKVIEPLLHVTPYQGMLQSVVDPHPSL